jgi:ATP-dependent RNA helicase DeaD
MENPVKVSTGTYVDPTKLKQVYYDIADNLKFSLLVHLLKHEKAGLVMVFCNTRKTVDFVAKNLNYAGVEAEAIHGGFSQGRRSRVMDKFHSQNVYVLVCTDLAARGLDIKGVSHIYNYDAPKESKQYIHRIGRTARAGEEGKAINLIASRDYESFGRVMQDSSLNIVKEVTPEVERVKIRYTGKPGFGPRGFGGRSQGEYRPRRYGFGHRTGRSYRR